MTLIITRTPLRVSFVGGGSDLPSYYLLKGGAVITSTLDYWIDVVIRNSPLSLIDTYKIKCLNHYQETKDSQLIENPIVRETIKFLNIKPPLEISSFSDIPSGTGLGSSSSFTVGLLQALYCYLGKDIKWEQLAEEAYYIEVELLKKPIGKQDQSIAAFGGLSHLIFNQDNTVTAGKIPCLNRTLSALEKKFMLFYVGKPREADSILSSITGYNQRQQDLLTQLCSFCEEFKLILQEGKHLNKIGEILDKSWQLKRKLSHSVSNNEIDQVYKISKKNGAIGGKLLGAGKSGFFLLYAEQSCHKKIRHALINFPEIPFRFSRQGSYVLACKN